jgi:hypothetical protein
MRKTAFMRPQDIVVLLKIVSLKNEPWRTTDLANQLFISQSEVSQALFRNLRAGLVDDSKRKVLKESFLEFLIHGIKFIFPQRPGSIVRGMPTAHSAPPLSKSIKQTGSIYVWPDIDGTVCGETIEPLYPTVPKAAKMDRAFYELSALVDAIRIGKTREYHNAVAELEKRIL